MADHHYYPHDLSNAAALASWPTPNTMDTIQPTRNLEQMEPKGHWGQGMNTGKLSETATLASWVSPQKGDGDRGHQAKRYLEKKHAVRLGDQSQLANWATPTSRDHKDSPNSLEQVEVNCLLGRQALLTASGETLSGSGAKTTSSGQLNPAFSLWLQGLPTGWASCGARATLSVRRKPRLS
jgi:hypothetical protein